MKLRLMEEIRPLSPQTLPEVHHWDSSDNGLLTSQALINKFKSMGYHCSVYTYPVGTYFPVHTHPVDKIDAVLEGKFCIKIFGKDVVLESGDWLIVPKGTPHSAQVVGSKPVTSIDAVRSG